MHKFNWSIVWGVLLVAAGVLFLLQSLDIIGQSVSIVWAVLFAAGGLAFVYVFVRDRTRWWAVIPGFSLLGLGIMMAMDQIFPRLAGLWGGMLFLGAIGLSFWVVYLTDRNKWWAIIPGGTLVTLALVAGIDALPRVADTRLFDTGGLFLIGMAATFLLVALLPNQHGPMKWAFIPAAVLLVLGIFVMAQTTALIGYIWPVGLILAGVIIVWRTLSARPQE
jgi:hypothetical protein